MAAEYVANAVQAVALNSPVLLNASIPCTRGWVYHENDTGIFILRGMTANCCNQYAVYKVTFNANIAVPTGGTAGPIAVALTVNGSERSTSRAIVTPAAVNEYGNVTSTAIIKVPRGCCFTIGVNAVDADADPTTTPAPVINVQNANLVIDRIA